MKSSMILVVILLVTFFACSSPTDYSNNSPTQKSVISDGIEYTLSIPKNNFALEDTLQVGFLVKNIASLTKEFRFANIQQFGFKVVDESNNVAMFYPLLVNPALSHFILEPGKSKDFSIPSLFKDLNGNYINKGNYMLTAYLLDNNSPDVSLKISVN